LKKSSFNKTKYNNFYLFIVYLRMQSVAQIQYPQVLG
jgi:hypothetical protein